MLLDTTISVKLKELFDRVYLSKSVFDKMINLVDQIQNFYDITDLNNRASDIYALVNEITTNVEIINAYEKCINDITAAKTDYDTDYLNNLNKIILYYSNTVYEEAMAAIEIMRETTVILDEQYTTIHPDVASLIAPYREFIDKISLITVNSIVITPDPGVFGATVPLTKNNCLQNNPTKQLMYAVVDSNVTTIAVLENGGYNASTTISIYLNDISTYLNGCSGYPPIVVGNFDTSEQRSFFSSDGTFVLYSNCTVLGLNIAIPVVIKVNYDLTYTFVFMNYPFITDKRILDFQSTPDDLYMQSYLFYKNGSTYWSTSGGTEFSTNLAVQYPGQMGYIPLINCGYFIKDNVIEFIKIPSYDNSNNLHSLVTFTTNIIGVNSTQYGLFILTSDGDVYILNIPTSLNTAIAFDVTKTKVTNTGVIYNTLVPFDGNIGMGIVSDRLFIVYPTNRFFYQIIASLYDDENIGYLKSNFIPTDDYFPWYTVRKPGEVVARNCIIFGYEGYISSEISSIDEPTPVFDGNPFGPESMKLAHSPVINDIIVSVENGGFAVTSINSRTGETYIRIIDDYEPDISVGNAKIDMQQIMMQGPEPHVIISVKELSECDIMIRRHAEMSKPSPTQYYALLWNSGLKVLNMDSGVINSSEGPCTFAKTSGLSFPISAPIKIPKDIIDIIKYKCTVGEIILFTTSNDKIYALNTNLTKIVCVTDKLGNFRNKISRFSYNQDGILSGGIFRLSKGSTSKFSNTCLIGISNSIKYLTFEINPIDLSIRNISSIKYFPEYTGGILPLFNIKGNMYVKGSWMNPMSFTALDGSGNITIPNSDQAWTDIDIIDIPFQSSKIILFLNDMNTGNSIIMLYRDDETYDTITVSGSVGGYTYNMFGGRFEISVGNVIKRFLYVAPSSGGGDSLVNLDDLIINNGINNIVAIGGGYYYDGRLLYSCERSNDIYDGVPIDYTINKIIHCDTCIIFMTPDRLKVCV